MVTRLLALTPIEADRTCWPGPFGPDSGRSVRTFWTLPTIKTPISGPAESEPAW
jgi:hypothetical protein